MIDIIFETIKGNPVLLLFIVLAIGFMIGGIRFGSFQLGSVAGVLLGGLLLGNFGFEGNAAIQSLGFVLFIFSVGYQAGPKFMEAVKKDGRRYFAISIIVAASGFLLAYGISRFFWFEPVITTHRWNYYFIGLGLPLRAGDSTAFCTKSIFVGYFVTTFFAIHKKPPQCKFVPL